MSIPSKIYPLIVGFSGKIGTGKDFLSMLCVNLLRIQYRVQTMAFADHLKICTYIHDQISYERLFYVKDTKSRLALQKRGMEMRSVDKEIFIRVMDCQLRLAKDRRVDIVLISDVRLLNEMDYIRDLGGDVLRIIAPRRTEIKIRQEVSELPLEEQKDAMERIRNHISESNLDNDDRFFATINNDLEQEKEAHKQLRDVLEKLKLNVMDKTTFKVVYG